MEYVKQLSNPHMDENMKITSFIEKPEHPTSSLIGTLIYIIKNSSLVHIADVIATGRADRAGDFIAYLCEKEDVYGSVLT